MMVASIETALELWAYSSCEVKQRMPGLLARERAAADAGLFLDGLLSDAQH
jgi:hypothetical protein